MEKKDSFSPLFLLFEFSNDINKSITGALEHFEEEDKKLTARGIFRVPDVNILISSRQFIKKISIMSSNEKIQTIEITSHGVQKYGVCKDEISEDLYVFYIVLSTP